MRDLRLLDAYRLRIPGFHPGGAGEGAFQIPSPATGSSLRVIASSGLGWDHVSVSLPNRCPNWPEMSRIKEMFFGADETVMQLHVPAADHVNNHPYCLHLWRPHGAEIPRPPALLVGVKELGPDEVAAMSPASRRALQAAMSAQIGPVA